MSSKHTWAFQARFRSKAFGWKGSALAIQRIKQAVSEIRKEAQANPLLAAEGTVTLFSRFWPALQHVDTSSGALGDAVEWAQHTLIPILVEAPADRTTREKWLDRLWQAILDDGVDYLSAVEDHWGELCVSKDLASWWADQFVDPIRATWSDPEAGTYVRGSCLCLSSLVAAGRYDDLFDLLALKRNPFWSHRKFGVQALLKEGRIDDAIRYAEESRPPTHLAPQIDYACEQILLDAGRTEEAYKRYAISSALHRSGTGLNIFRFVKKKYPDRDPREVLLDLALASDQLGMWFAAAKDEGYTDLAVRFAIDGKTDPRTLSRAARDFIDKDPQFALTIGRLAVERILQGYGYEMTMEDLLSAYRNYMAVAIELGGSDAARADILALAESAKRSKLASNLSSWIRKGA